MEALYWCSTQPKLELHAHVNVSARDSTLLELSRALGENGSLILIDVKPWKQRWKLDVRAVEVCSTDIGNERCESSR